MLNISLKRVKCQLIISSKENSLFFELISILSEVKHYNGEDIQNLCTSLGFIQHKNICKFRGNVHAESRILSEFLTIFIKITHITHHQFGGTSASSCLPESPPEAAKEASLLHNRICDTDATDAASIIASGWQCGSSAIMEDLTSVE